ncbi:hypothetical protein GCM10009574_054770 [Streptomyces asiaticus]
MVHLAAPPLTSAARRTLFLARAVPRDRASLHAFAQALAGLPGTLAHRAVVPNRVERGLRLLDETQRVSTARRYVG